MTHRWDETWHRLLEWTNDQGPSERLAAQVLLHEGFSALDPSHPLGGKDGGKDAICTKGGIQWVMGVYFPRGQQEFSNIEKKFKADLQGAQANGAQGFTFVTNQELRLSERKALLSAWPSRVELYHLERLTAILDCPAMHTVRKQFLGIDFDDRNRGGEGGHAVALSGGTATGGAGGDAGARGNGGVGGYAVAEGERSWAMGGPGGRGGTRPGGKGMDVKARRNSITAGGEGGSAPQPDGRSGRGGRSGGQLIGIETERLPDGRYPGEGGRGRNSAAYDGKVATIKRLLREYYNNEPLCVTGADYYSAIPLEWLNRRLQQLGSHWNVRLDDGEFHFFEVAQTPVVAGDEKGRQCCQTEGGNSTIVKGIALLVCNRIAWKNCKEGSSCPRDIFHTMDALGYDRFPHACGPLAAYILLAGSGTVPISLLLEAPNGETVVARHIVAANWGEIGSWEWVPHIGEFQLAQPGIYHWRIVHEDTVLLDRPMIVRLLVQEADQTEGQIGK